MDRSVNGCSNAMVGQLWKAFIPPYSNGWLIMTLLSLLYPLKNSIYRTEPFSSPSAVISHEAIDTSMISNNQ